MSIRHKNTTFPTRTYAPRKQIQARKIDESRLYLGTQSGPSPDTLSPPAQPQPQHRSKNRLQKSAPPSTSTRLQKQKSRLIKDGFGKDEQKKTALFIALARCQGATLGNVIGIMKLLVAVQPNLGIRGRSEKRCGFRHITETVFVGITQPKIPVLQIAHIRLEATPLHI